VFFSFSPGKVRLLGLLFALRQLADIRCIWLRVGSDSRGCDDAIGLPWIMAIMEWKPINTVPLERDVEIGATDSTGMHAVACPCRLTEPGGSRLKVKGGFTGYALRTGEICRVMSQMKTRLKGSVVLRLL
jgi:hypothetical protein